jgi:tRNA threonylcarbamoyladenosine biosynthesis protein TsaB
VVVKLLALDTSGELCSAALWLDGEAAWRDAPAGRRHSQLLLPMVDALLRGAGLRPDDLDGIAFGSGPGSFTGLRIACGVAQGLAFSAGVPVLGVPTLMALAEASAAVRALCCVDARMGEIYHAAYERRDGQWATVSEPALYRPQTVPLPDGAGWVGVGNGFAVHRDALGERCGARLDRVDAAAVPHAREMARLAAAGFARGLGTAPDDALPLYVRDKVALRSDER